MPRKPAIKGPYGPGDRLRAPTVQYLLEQVAQVEPRNGVPSVAAPGTPGQSRLDRHNPAIIRVRNNSGYALDRYGVQAIYEPIIDPDDSEAGFEQYPAMEGRDPTSADYGSFAVLIDALPDGQIGRAVVAGVVQCKVNITDTDHTHCDIDEGDRTRLESNANGTARILWRNGSGTGEVWALVRLADCSYTAGTGISIADNTITCTVTGTDELVAVSANDTTPGYLNPKIDTSSAANGDEWIDGTEINDGGNETLALTHGTPQAEDDRQSFIADLNYYDTVDSCLNHKDGYIAWDAKGHVTDAGQDSTWDLVPATVTPP